ncbi:MAG: HD domain-containing protein [Desulfobulbaceae bacterium]|nr:HD domain-containing protein [Desulfobulbaceae bacterium]
MEPKEPTKKIAGLELTPPEELLAALLSLINNVRLHQSNNVLVIKCVARLLLAAGRLFAEESEISVQIAKGTFYICGDKLPYRRSSALLVENLLKFMERRGLVGLRFYPAMLVAPVEQLVAFAGLLHESAQHKNPLDWLVLRLEEAKLQWLAMLQPEIGDSADAAAGLGRHGEDRGAGSGPGGFGGGLGAASVPGGGPEGGPGTSSAGRRQESQVRSGAGAGGGGDREDAPPVLEVPGQRSPRRLYAYALEAMREVADKISGNQRAGIRNAVRIVQNMVEEVTLQEQPLLLAMSTVRVYDDYTFSHSVNVAILSMFLGKKIGVNKDTLEALGICGLFHDLGKVLIPAEILKKQSRLTAEELAEIHKHSLNSTRLIMRLRASAKRKSAIVMPPLEHHLRYDLTGYPEIGWKKPQSLCGRILAICDHFDALTSPRVYRDHAFSADQALGMMMGMSGQAFDPLLLKLFINILGVYPIGTLLELENGDIGLVCRSPETQVMSRPWVLLLYPDGRGGYLKGEEINLAAKDKAGYYFHSVQGSANPVLFNIQPAEFLT